MRWTRENVELLRTMWLGGSSAGEITRKLVGASRGAVMGKIHRLGLPLRGAEGARQRVRAEKERVARKEPVHRAKKLPAEKAAAFVEPPVRPDAPPMRRLELVALESRDCRWPINGEESGAFLFCGNEQREKTPYCAYHGRLAYRVERPAPQRGAR